MGWRGDGTTRTVRQNGVESYAPGRKEHLDEQAAGHTRPGT
jgi:hypothetical protein